MNALETMALTEKKRKKVQVCERKNLVRIIIGEKMDEMRVEVGVKESSKKKLMRSTWAGQEEKSGS